MPNFKLSPVLGLLSRHAWEQLGVASQAKGDSPLSPSAGGASSDEGIVSGFGEGQYR